MTGPGDAPPAPPSPSARRRLAAAVPDRLLLLAVALAVVAGAALALVNEHPPHQSTPVPDVVWIAGFAMAEMCAVRIHFRRESHTFSLSEIPLVAGLYLLSPRALALTRCAGTIAALGLGRRQGPVKLLFNAALVTLSSVVAATTFERFSAGADAQSPSGWAFALLAALVGETVSMAAIHVTLLIVEGTAPWQTLPLAFAFGVVAIGVNGSVGLLVALTLPQEPVTLLLIGAPAATMLFLYRAYAGERRSHQQSDLLYEATRDLQRSGADVHAVEKVLRRVRLLMGADVAEVVLLDDAGVPLQMLRDTSETADAGDRDPAAWLHGRTHSVGSVVVRWSTLADAPPRARGQAVVATVGEGAAVRCAMLVAHGGEQVRRFNHGDARLVEAVASHILSALEAIRLSRRLEQQAYHDALTGLPNRLQLTRRVGDALRRLEDGDVPAVSLLLVDLDDFKLANDSVGHLAGDRLLQEAATRIAGAVHGEDVVARLGGDEFAVLCIEVGEAGRALATAEAIIAALQQPARIDARELSVRGSVGIAHARPGDSVETLVRHADIAMYHAKDLGKRRIELFDPRLEAALVQQLGMRADLERAVERRQFEVAYQPIVALATGRPSGVEALVRWRHPERGIVAPSEFVELAEQTGLIEPIGEIVLAAACSDLVRWRSRGAWAAHCTVSFNAAPRQLRDPDFTARAIAIIDASGLAARDLVLEVTETALLENHDVAVANLERFRNAGGRVALDDFGTGYSSLAYLRTLPVDIVKIDRTFIQDLENNGSDRSLTLAIVRLLGTLELVTVAEGIETQAQLDYVRAIGCDNAQGFLFAEPVLAGAAEALLAHPAWLSSAWPLAVQLVS